MGGCCSRHESGDAHQVAPRGISVVDDQVVRCSRALGGIKVYPFRAIGPATYPYESFTGVVATGGGVFAALFDGCSSPAAAQLGISACYDKFRYHMQCHNVGLVESLKRALTDIDLGTMEAHEGRVSAVVVYLDTSTATCYIASQGTCSCLLGRTRGAFHRSSVEVVDLARGCQPRREAPVHAVTEACGNLMPLSHEGDLTKHGPQVMTYVLSDLDEHLILTSEGLLSLTSKHEVALMCHCFSIGRIKYWHEVYLRNRHQPPVQGGSPTSGAETVPSEDVELTKADLNMAALLVRLGMFKARENYNRQHLDVELDHEGLKDMRLQTPGGSGKRRRRQKSGRSPMLTTSGPTKRDIHPNLCALVLGIERPNSNANAQIQQSHAIKASWTQNRMALYRWQLVKMWYKFLSARRQHYLQQWWAVVDEAVLAADRTAREVEVAAWKHLGCAVNVSRVGNDYKVTPATGIATRGSTGHSLSLTTDLPNPSSCHVGPPSLPCSPLSGTQAAGDHHPASSLMSPSCEPKHHERGGGSTSSAVATAAQLASEAVAKVKLMKATRSRAEPLGSCKDETEDKPLLGQQDGSGDIKNLDDLCNGPPSPPPSGQVPVKAIAVKCSHRAAAAHHGNPGRFGSGEGRRVSLRGPPKKPAGDTQPVVAKVASKASGQARTLGAHHTGDVHHVPEKWRGARTVDKHPRGGKPVAPKEQGEGGRLSPGFYPTAANFYQSARI